MSDFARKEGLICMFGVMMIALMVPTTGTAGTPQQANPIPGKSHVATTLLKTPLSFEANQGQTDESVNFIARGSGYTLFLTPTESVMVMQQRETAPQTADLADPLPMTEPTSIKQSIVRMKLEGANPTPSVEGQEQLPGIVNYFIGNDPAKWRTTIPTYAKVHYKDAYPGIDVAYYGNQGRLEYDFIVAPGADPNQIKLAFEGASEIKVTDSGDLLLTTALGGVRMQKPVVYQLEKNGHKTLVAGNYLASSRFDNEVGIQLAVYDANKTIVIDPVIIYSSFIGGIGTDNANDVAVDSSGNAWVAGFASSALTLPAVGVPYDSTFNGSFDVFLLKVSPSGTLLVWTYLGGTFSDNTPALALDGAGNVWLTGTTGGTTFPITPGALQPVHAGSADAFVSKFDSNASSLMYSTFYGGSGTDNPRSIAVDGSGSIVHITGNTNSTSLPGITASSLQPVYGGGVQDGFVVKLDIPSAQILYATYLEGVTGTNLQECKLMHRGMPTLPGERSPRIFRERP